ncbi:MAG: hypothetical protein WA624_08170 [Methylocella sp.]
MHTKKISMFSGAALLALNAAAWAGPTSVASAKLIAPPQTQTEPVAYRYRHHYRHYGWYHHRYRHYGWHYYNPVAAAAGAAVGLATVPFALATGGYYYGYPYYYY